MKEDSEKIVSTNCYNNLHIAAFKSAPTPNAKQNSESSFSSVS